MKYRGSLLCLLLVFAFLVLSCHHHGGGFSFARGMVGTEDRLLASALRHDPRALSARRIRQYSKAVATETDEVRASLPQEAGEEVLLFALNRHFFGPDGLQVVREARAPEGRSIAAVLDSRRGTCIGLAIVYLTMARQLGLDAHALATPDHVFIRVQLGDKTRNVELLEAGRELDDDMYRRRHKIDQASIDNGVFLRDLTDDEVIAHLLQNQAVALSAEGRLDEAFKRYTEALKLNPKLVAAWYNQGIDLMNAGRLEEALASFNRAIELYPSDAQAHNNRGLAKVKLGDAVGAEADFRQALEIEPSLHEAEENLKRLLASRQAQPAQAP